jgi:hypothetical protein
MAEESLFASVLTFAAIRRGMELLLWADGGPNSNNGRTI